MHPALFFVWPVVVFFVFLALLRYDERRSARRDLSASARVSVPARQGPVRLPPAAGSVPGRTALPAAQERAARAALRSRTGLVSVSPSRCPVDEDLRG